MTGERRSGRRGLTRLGPRLDPLDRDGSEAFGGDRLKRRAERGDVLGAEALGPVAFDVFDQAAANRLRVAAAVGQPDDLRAAVGGVRHPLEVAALLEVAGDLAD